MMTDKIVVNKMYLKKKKKYDDCCNVLQVSDLLNQQQSDFMIPDYLFTYSWMTSQAKLEFV